jgi:Tol biopolymer transport system component
VRGKLFGIVLPLVAFITSAVLVAQAPRSVEAQLKAAQHKEEVEGDVKGAIEDYAKIAQGSDRALAARALIRMAECYQKLGQSESRGVYERIVRDFAEQTGAVVLARARLGRRENPGQSPATTLRRIWAGPKVDTTGGVSPDGRYLSYVDWDTGNLAIRDFASGSDRRLTNKGSWMQSDEFAEQSVISKDGKELAYAWFNGKDRYEIRVVDLHTSGIPQSRRIFDNPDVLWIGPFDWSADGRWLAVALSRFDRSSQIGLVDVRDGSLRVLKSVDWRTVSRMFFSPDGKHLAMDLPAGDRISDKSDVFVMATDGSRETPVAPSPGFDVAMGWSPDGTELLFASDRGGTRGLWAQRMENGTPYRTPELLKSDIGHTSLGLSRDGKLFAGVNVGDLDIHVASVDFRTGRIVTPPSRAAETFIGSNRQPDWSPDGKYLSYVVGRGRRDRVATLAIRSMETGDVREVLPAELANFYNPEWGPDGRSVIAQGIDLKGRRGLYQIDTGTGSTSPVVITEPGTFASMPTWSADGKKLYYRLSVGEDTAFIERDIASGRDRDVIRRRRSGGVTLGGVTLSPDGKYIATRHDVDKHSTVVIIPVAGGEPREILRVAQPHFIQGVHGWAPGGTDVIAVRIAGDTENPDVLLIPTTGGAPRLLEVPGFSRGAVRVHPDGRRIAYLAGKSAAEVWVLENFLPALTAKK